MKRTILLTLMGTMSLFAQNHSADHIALRWKNLLPQYTSIVQIKPVLVNDGMHSVFVYAPHDSVQATIERFNDKKGVWEQEDLDLVCVAQPASSALTPTEIKANSEQKVRFSLTSVAAGSAENGYILVGGGPGEKRPLEGKYRLPVSYALDYGAAGRVPKAWRTMYSPEFFIAKE